MPTRVSLLYKCLERRERERERQEKRGRQIEGREREAEAATATTMMMFAKEKEEEIREADNREAERLPSETVSLSPEGVSGWIP